MKQHLSPHESFSHFLENALNKPQHEAVMQKAGALLVIAGAGSGKTRVITARIAHLIINQSVDPHSIIALTFTNKAAGEMKERLTHFLGTNHKLPFVGTFHAYCLLLLRANPRLLKFQEFSILDGDDQVEMIKKIIKLNGLTKYFAASQVLYQISQLKNKSHSDDPADQLTLQPAVQEIYLEYEAQKAAAHAFDFDDLILQVLYLFKNNPEFKDTFQKKVRHVLVDEYQDTNHVQHNLLKQMSLNPTQQFSLNSLCAVGDEDQSIYSWRGATVTNMLKFQKDFAPVTQIKIEQNYRSVQPILDAANTVIANNQLRNPKNLWSEKQAHNRIVLGSCRSGEQEAEVIGQFLQALPHEKKRSEIAILYRTHYQSRSIEEALIYHGIPYRIIGGIRFYERKEIKDLLAYLRLIVNPYDKLSLMRVINCPNRGLGQKFEEQLLQSWIHNPMLDFAQLLTWLCQNPEADLSTTKKTAVLEFLEFYQGLTKDTLPHQAIERILNSTEYISYLRNSYEPKEADTKIENVKEFVESIHTFEQKYTHAMQSSILVSSFIHQTPLEALLYEVALMQEKIDAQHHDDQVQMMTLHAAKGLEFDTVIITGLEEGVLPSSKSLTTTQELEEERRLFYVGITRAKEYLLLLTASYRNTFGQIIDQVPSRFIQELPEHCLVKQNFEKVYPSHMKNFFARWLNNDAALISSLVTFGASSPAPTEEVNPASTRNTSSPQGQEETWNKNDLVLHKKFGTGIITQVEKIQEDGQELFYITALFRSGPKKLLSTYLEKGAV